VDCKAGGADSDRFRIAPTTRARLFAFLRFLAFAAIFVGANFGEHVLLTPVHRHIKSFEGHALLEMSALGVIALALTYLLAKISGRGFGAYGLAGPHRTRNFIIGLSTGIALLALQLVVERSLGVFSFGSPGPLDGALAANAILIGVFCLTVGFTEEILFRGYPLVEVSRAISFWPAVIVISAMFGVPHWLKGDGENLMGGIQACMFGIALACSFRMTGSLWLAIGFHAGWDYAQSFVFGVADSGLVSAGRLLHPAIHGPAWLSGGSVGPEGSVLALLSLAFLLTTAWLCRERAVNTTGNREPAHNRAKAGPWR
jgi:hypothetical protein